MANGKLFDGATGNAGHVGHVIVSRGGPRCYCGGVGCLTVYASGTGLAERARRALRRRKDSAMSGLSPEEVTGQAIARAAAEGDPLASRLMNDAALALARGIAGAANLLDLDRVVIGGGVAQSGDLLFVPLVRELRRRATLAFSRNVEVRPALLGAEAGVVGAASLIFQQYIPGPSGEISPTESQLPVNPTAPAAPAPTPAPTSTTTAAAQARASAVDSARS